ncbi:MAG: hypothetical protein EXR63_03335 [Dehalococcoidia bacterium]|nr:hypothetical protein [Dehalococcoidia bacterium]
MLVAGAAWLAAAALFVVVGAAAFALSGVDGASSRAILVLYPLFFSGSAVAVWLLYVTLYYAGYRLRGTRTGRRGALAAAHTRALQWTALLLYAYALIAVIAAGVLLVLAAMG